MNPDVGSLPDNTLLTDNAIRFKVLVVDQPGPHLEYLVQVLREVGYNVDAASDSETTHRKLRSSVRPVDLLIIDLECLREVDGLRFLKALKKEDFCGSTQLIITTHRLLDERLSQVSRDLAIRACFNKARPLEELLCLATSVLPPSGHNLRASRRFPVKFLLHYTVGANPCPYYATNLSRGGIFILNSKPDPVDTEVELAFILPRNTVLLKAGAKVARVVHQILEVGTSQYQMFPPGNGLAFVEMAAEHRRILNEFCESEETRIFGMPAPLSTKSMGENKCQLAS